MPKTVPCIEQVEWNLWRVLSQQGHGVSTFPHCILAGALTMVVWLLGLQKKREMLFLDQPHTSFIANRIPVLLRWLSLLHPHVALIFPSKDCLRNGHATQTSERLWKLLEGDCWGVKEVGPSKEEELNGARL